MKNRNLLDLVANLDLVALIEEGYSFLGNLIMNRVS